MFYYNELTNHFSLGFKVYLPKFNFDKISFIANRV